LTESTGGCKAAHQIRQTVSGYLEQGRFLAGDEETLAACIGLIAVFELRSKSTNVSEAKAVLGSAYAFSPGN